MDGGLLLVVCPKSHLSWFLKREKFYFIILSLLCYCLHCKSIQLKFRICVLRVKIERHVLLSILFLKVPSYMITIWMLVIQTKWTSMCYACSIGRGSSLKSLVWDYQTTMCVFVREQVNTQEHI